VTRILLQFRRIARGQGPKEGAVHVVDLHQQSWRQLGKSSQVEVEFLLDLFGGKLDGLIYLSDLAANTQFKQAAKLKCQCATDACYQ